MADEKILQLDPLVTPALTDAYELSANGDGSFYETRAQMLSYMQANSLPSFYSVGMLTTYIAGDALRIANGACKDSTNAYNVFFTTARNLNAATVGANGLDTGVLEASTQYYVYVIKDITGANPDAGIISKNSTTPAYPTGYSVKLRRASIQTNSDTDFDRTTLINFVNVLPINNPIFSGSLTDQAGNFKWDATTYTLLAGQGAHITGGSNNVLLGVGATSNYDGSFVCTGADSDPEGDRFVVKNNQAIFWKIGGFGLNTNSSGGVEGPQASFHSARNYGAVGDFLFSAFSAVDTDKMVACEVNPHIHENVLSLKYLGSTASEKAKVIPASLYTNIALPDSVTVTQFIGGVLSVYASAPGGELTLPDAMDLWLALGSPPVDTTFTVQILNRSDNYSITLVPGAGMSFSWMPTTVIGIGQTFDLIFSFSVVDPITPDIAVEGHGGTNLLTAVNIPASTNFRYVGGVNSSNISTAGSIVKPYATVAYALTQITDESDNNRYTIILSGIVSESTNVNLRQNIAIWSFDSAIWYFSGSSTLAIDPSFDVAGSAAINLNGFTLRADTGQYLRTNTFSAGGQKTINCNIIADCNFNFVLDQTTLVDLKKTVIPAGRVTNINDPYYCIFSGYQSGILQVISNSSIYSSYMLVQDSIQYTGASLRGSINNTQQIYIDIKTSTTVDNSAYGNNARAVFKTDVVSYSIPNPSSSGVHVKTQTTFGKESAYSTSTTISALDLVTNRIIFSVPATPITLTFPDAVDIDAQLGNPYVDTVVESVSITNVDAANSITLAPGSGTTLTGVPSLVIPPKSTGFFTIRKSTGVPAYIVYGGVPITSASDATLAGNNNFTGVNTFSGHPTSFDEINTAYAGINGPAVVTSSFGFSASPSGPISTGSFTLTAAQAAGIIVQLNGGLATQAVFLPTAADFEAQLLASFPSGGSIPTFTAYKLRIVNESTTATAILTTNINFILNNALISQVPPSTPRDYIILKTANTPEYTLY